MTPILRQAQDYFPSITNASQKKGCLYLSFVILCAAINDVFLYSGIADKLT